MWASFAEKRITRDAPKVYTYLNSNLLGTNPDVSIIIPVFNQEEKIKRNIRSLLEQISEKCELIILDDASEDKSNEELHRFFSKNFAFPLNLISITIVTFKKARFETYCDHFGISLAKGSYIIEIQADMQIHEREFDKKMINILKSHEDVFMLSGRGIMDYETIASHFRKSHGTEAAFTVSIFKFLKNRLAPTKAIPNNNSEIDIHGLKKLFPSPEEFERTGNAGRLGRLIEIDAPFSADKFYIGETVMRGPIAFNKKRLSLIHI